ncbi:uncharacterized protein PSANT_06125 [Moesziomyces antarcticus]|nr:uncharacterized protein PSANT_06125 [Moesziomyces antarcticus]
MTPAPALSTIQAFHTQPSQAAPTPIPASTTADRDYQQLAADASTSSAPPNHNVDVQVAQPVECDYMNITFDPSRGTPPYTVMISIEDYWPVTVSLPATYDDASKDLWLYQYPVPSFTGPTKNPSLIVTVTDASGLMANSSAFVQVNSAPTGATCAPFDYAGSFFFYTQGAASMCQDYSIFWDGSYAPPVTAVFLPELAPPIYVPAPSLTSSNMSWEVAMQGGTRFVMTLGDSRAVGGSGGVSKLNIVALNEYYTDSCIAQANYQHRVFAPASTAPPASVFPDATSTLASLTTSGGIVATVTVIETIKNGRTVHGKGGGGLSSVGFLVVMIVVFATFGLMGVALGWFCYRRRQKRKHNIKAWDLPNSDPSVPFNADPNMPIAPGVFGRSVTRQASTNTRNAADRASLSGVSNYDPVSLSSRPLGHAPSTRASLRSWTSSAFDHFHIATGAQQTGAHQPAHTGDYALMDAGSAAADAHVSSRGGHHARSPTSGTLSNSSREAWSPTDSIPRTFGFYSDDPQTPSYLQSRTGSPPSVSRSTSADGASSKSTRVGAGPTYRPDAASQAAYHDLLASNTTRMNSVRNVAGARTQGWADLSGEQRDGRLVGSDPSTRIVRHSDAGLLLDDNDNGDELINLREGRVMELPPQYDTIHPSTGSHQRPLYEQAAQSYSQSYGGQQGTRARQHVRALDSVDISEAGNRPAEVHAADLVDENDDESAFWAH